MKSLSYFLITIALFSILVGCNGTKDKVHSAFVGTWQTVSDTEKEVTIKKNDDHLFKLALDNFDFSENNNLVTVEDTKEDLILKSHDTGSIYSFHMINNNQLEFYFSANPDENLVGESPPIILKRVK
ncbi:hypothetical protein [Enterococcus wangshanyuanii]|uniref:DUF4828 domain-containing protein n=1 Tax=Enterococcus wangshanyuanii TaxID=2005703 RepID=A0ABQ1P8P8_9ENTE|nr:hypothetical protein [Enterococcus wangshanyuanii]GGC91312.1 hypothetical protein GCM10011573_21140 [Enterococcus wangshanyuanii]